MDAKKHGRATPPSAPNAARAGQAALANQQRSQQQVQPRSGSRVRHPALCVFFTTVWLVFFLFFLLPWQLHHRPGWNFHKSVKHDYHIYKGAVNSFFASAHETPDIVVPQQEPPSPPDLVFDTQPKMSNEQTFIAIKPDGVQRGLVGSIIGRFESRGYKLAAIKLVTPGKAHLESHYADLKDKPFFAGLVEYMNSGPICAMVWEGRDAVKTGRTLLGATNPLSSAPGTIRGDFAIDVGRNVCHGSDSVENAKKEIALWFKEGEVVSWQSAQASWIYEKP
ncbi:nucleoside diphosphate kinase [Astrocystis sublimbata]|nr:nucleoside diphosphate kinase [Astrocystis sublimbata]